MGLFVLITVIITVAVTLNPTLANPITNEHNNVFQLLYKTQNNENNANIRLRRQADRFNNGFGNRFDDEDEWFVFDEVEEDRPRIEPTVRQSFNWPIAPSPKPTPSRPRLTPPSPRPTPPRPQPTTQRPTIPNAGGPRLGRCEEKCNARTTAEYNPVCGDNGVTYFNNSRFECARFCGSNVRATRGGRCGPLLPF